MDALRLRKAIASLFALALGAGYIAALANTYFSVPTPGGMPTLDDLATHYHGHPDVSLLELNIKGPMRPNLKDDAQLQTLLAWIHNGARQDDFAPAKQIIDAQCIKCHVKGGMAGFRPLTSYDDVAAVAALDKGMSWGQMARITHAHLFAIGLLCFALAWGLMQTPRSPGFIAGAMALGVFGLLIDFGGMWLTKLDPRFVYLIVAGAAMTGLYFGVGIFLIWLDFLFGKKASPRQSRPVAG